MAKYHDLRPTSPDSLLKKLKGEVVNKQTIPHGVKVARPYEATIYEDSSGGQWRWDGDARAELNSRLAAGEARIAEAEANLEQAQADLREARQRIGDATVSLGEYESRVEAAESELASAKNAQESLESRLGVAETDISELTDSVDSAVADALAAGEKATAATGAAQAAMEQAESVTIAASEARDFAAAAEAKALEAAGLAAGKGKVIYQVSKPTGGNAKPENLWIRSSDNVPHRYNPGTGGWEAVTDKTATDAAAAASAAQVAADSAAKAAAAAAETAQAAQIAAGNAQRSADGKTTVQYGTRTPPPVDGVTVGDIYYYTGSDHRIMETWQWSGSGWLKRALESAQLANFDAGYITSGYLDVAKRIQAGSIYADKLTIGIGDNIVPNGGGQAADGWSSFSYDNSGAAENNGWPGSFYITGRRTLTSSYAPIAPGEYQFSVDVKGEHDGGRFCVQIMCYAVSGANVTPNPYPVLNQPIPNGTWQRYTGKITIPQGTAKFAVRVYSQHSIGTVDETRRVWYTGFSLREMKDGSLIVNGSITGDKVNAQSVAAAVGSFVQVKATNVEVTGDLSARIVNSMSATTKRLVVTEETLLNHATLLGNTVVERINITGGLVGRDAILTGTVDVAQLHVNEEMSAEIVRAMTTETKELVVSEEAILKRATVIENIVTPELVAEKISSALVTGEVLQTSPLENTGVKISNTGYRAWDASGRLTVDLNGKDNTIIGSFQTNTTDVNAPRVLIGVGGSGAVDLYGGNTTNHGVVWYSKVGSDKDPVGSLKVVATAGSYTNGSEPGFFLNSALGTLDVRGAYDRDGQAHKYMQVEISNIASGGWSDQTITWKKPFLTGTMPVYHISPSNSAGAEVAWVILEQDRYHVKFRIKNLAPRATGYNWIRVTGIAYK